MDRGYQVHLANTTAIEQYNGLKHTDDDSDAEYLADQHTHGNPDPDPDQHAYDHPD